MKKDRSKKKYYKNDEFRFANEQKRNKIIQRRINRD